MDMITKLLDLYSVRDNMSLHKELRSVRDMVKCYALIPFL